MQKTPLNIVICGGGTAGWMTAAGLVGALPRGAVSITLIESEDIGTVGVGEATLPHLKDFNDFVGIDEREFMQATNATFKLGIQFKDWGFVGSSYLHPFGVHGRPIGGLGFLQHWLRGRLHGGLDTDIQDYSLAIQACEANRFGFPTGGADDISASYSWAYHLDAGLYATFLRSFAEVRGVRRVEGMIQSVDRDMDSGDITSVSLQQGEKITGDLFIDCTGFRSLLLGQALGESWEDWSRWLPCDRAVALPSCAMPDTKLPPFTCATARGAGWSWQIPLQSRTGNGYVYASQHVSDDEAHANLVSWIGGEPTGAPNFLKFQAGRRSHSWSANCVGIGLSSGFLEPLESTSIYLIQIAITNLIKLLPERNIEPALRDSFNRLIDGEYDRIRDFLILHYHLNERDDAELWRYARDMDVPDSLKHKMEIFRHRGSIEAYISGLFSPPSWEAVFLGQGLAPKGYNALANRHPLEQSLKAVSREKEAVDEAVSRLKSHGEFLRDYCASDMPAGVKEVFV